MNVFGVVAGFGLSNGFGKPSPQLNLVVRQTKELIMRRLTREHLFRNYGDPSTLPASPPLRVDQEETFIIETVDTRHILMFSEADVDKPGGPMAGNPSTGPVYIEGLTKPAPQMNRSLFSVGNALRPVPIL